eukprot:scaffold130668_cov21-Phaeocystis_antarctica.AAC.1
MGVSWAWRACATALWLPREPCPRENNPPKQWCLISDLWCPTFARCAAGPRLLKMADRARPQNRWLRKPPASLQAGRRGATTGFAPPVTLGGCL